MRRRAIYLGVVVCVVSAAVVWLRIGRPVPPRDHRGANILLITIDTLRADRLGCYGNTPELTPTLDALAARGVRFARAWSHAPITLPAHASILTGVVPPHHGVRNNGGFRLGDTPATLAERLREAGYRTGAFVGAFVLDARFGLNRGFDEYDDRYESAPGASFHFTERTADRVLTAATAWIQKGSRQPWFAWVHLFDPHAPYKAPAEFASAHVPYDAEVAWTDAALGKALAGLESAALLQNTIVIVTADHGESLGSHGETTHGLFAYDATLRVPLIIAVPGMPARVVNTPVSHVDLLPTILDLVAVNVPGSIDGHSRRGDIEGTSTTEATPIYFEALDASLTRGWAPLRGIIADPWKYIELPEPELYDLNADASEQNNLFDRDPARVRELQSHLRQRAGSSDVVVNRAMNASETEALRSLGYIGSSAATGAPITDADDPKRLVEVSETFNSALDDFSNGRVNVAIEKFVAVLGERPDFLAARLSAATALMSSSRAAAAIQLLERAPDAQKKAASWHTRMGQALAADGKLAEAQRELESASADASGDLEPLNELGVVLLRLGKQDEARRAFERLLKADPTATGTWFNVGLLEMNARRSDAAAAAFRHVVDLEPRHAGAWQGLGAALAATNPTEAAVAWKRAVEIDPRDYDTLYNLGMLLADSHSPDAAPFLKRFLDEAPRDRYARDLPQVRARLAQAEAGR
jgi:arylsulfatase A-like enzyme/Flp pilus assembly protein TadD